MSSKSRVHFRDEDEGLLASASPSIQDDDHLSGDEERQQQESGEVLESAGKKDIALMIFINFLSFVCFAIVLPSLWPFLKSFGVNQSWTGWAVAVNSGGTFLASPILGKWTDLRGVKEALFISLAVMIGGNIMYALSQDVWMLLASRFIVGCAAANYAPASAYLTYATHPNDRTTVMIANSAASILGFILGPAMATGLSALPAFELSVFKGNDLTYPGWASVLLALFCLIFVPTVKNIRPRKVTPETDDSGKKSEQEGSDALNHPYLNPIAEDEHLLVLAPELDRRRGGRAEVMYHIQEDGQDEEGMEEGGQTFAMDSFSVYTPVDSHLISPSVLQAGEGVFPAKGALDPSSLSQAHIATETNPYVKPSDASMRSLKTLAQPGLPIWTVIVVLYLQFAFYNAFTVFETIGTPYTQHAYGWSVTTNGFLFAGIGGGCIVSLVILQVGAMLFQDRTLLLVTEVLMAGGFGLLIQWPFDEYVELPRFLIGVGLASVGFSSACAVVISIFSKLLENVEQGVMMGWLSASGSLARVAGPLFSAYVLQYVGGGLVFLITASMLVVALVLTLAFFPHLKTAHKGDTAAASATTAPKATPSGSAKRRQKSGGKIRYADERPTAAEQSSLINSEYDDHETWD